MSSKLKLLPAEKYKGVNQYDPIKYYYWPVFGPMYRRRVELALDECTGGERILEVGFGTGLAFPNLHDMYKEIHGIDLTADIHAVKSVFEPLNIPLFLEKGDVLKMPYEDNFFDTVLLVSILEMCIRDRYREIQNNRDNHNKYAYCIPKDAFEKYSPFL